MNRKAFLTKAVFLALAVSISACSSTKKLKEGEYLLVKNSVTANRKDIPTQTEIIYLVKPAACTRFLGYPWKTAVYQSMLPEDGKKDRKWRQWFRKNLGEEPVLLDSDAVAYSQNQIRQYLYNKGYFESDVQSEIRTGKRKADVSYRITAGEPYRLNELTYQIGDTAIRRLVAGDRTNSLLKKGMKFDADIFQAERNRITGMLNNEGYYLFRTDMISYRVDSNLNSRRFNLTLIIGNEKRADSSNVTGASSFRKYYIRNVEIRYTLSEESGMTTETYREKGGNGVENLYTLQHSNDIRYKPKALVRPLSVTPGSRYSALETKNTYNRFHEMENFRLIRISYIQTAESRKHPETDSGWLDCHIQLSPWEKHKLGLELLGKDIGNDYGIGVNLNLKNRNLFHGGEIQYDNLLFSTEFEKSTTNGEGNEDVPMWRYRNFELGGELGIHFPKMLFPFSQSIFPKKHRAQTRISAGSYFQQRDHYSRFITNTGLEYEWKPSTRASHIVKLLDINIVNIYKDSIFDRNLSNYSQRIREKYTSHVLAGANYKFLYNNMKGSERQDFFRLRLNLNAYGNLLYGLFALSNAGKNQKGQYTVAGTPFTSFVSGDADFTYNWMLWKRSAFVIHTGAGIGLPTSNASTLPFERSFYLGGANSLRAWKLRSVGPGSYHGTLSNFESSGDIKLEANMELRTPIYKNIFTALFVDMGNIWNRQKTQGIPDGEFDWNRFYKEFAIDGGIGIRLDVSLLVLRMDAAIPLYTPYLPENSRWINETPKFSDIHFCFGIGYPF